MHRYAAFGCAVVALALIAALPIAHFAAGDWLADPLADAAFFALVLAICIPRSARDA